MEKDKCLDIFERYIQRQASDEEVDLLRSFINNDQALNKWLESQIEDAASEIDVDVKMRMLDNIRSNTNYDVQEDEIAKIKKPMKFYLRWVANIAAILLPIVLILGVYMYTQAPKVEHLTVSAGPGERASINLPDGSKVAVNSGSKVIYNTAYNKKERFLQLEGEAYFEVEHDPSKPFIVECGDVKIKVLGTTFGINAYNDNEVISVVLNSGKIEFITPNETLAMSPNDRVTYDRKTKHVETTQVNAVDYTEWRENRLRFENETLEHIVKVISRMHNTDIVFEDDLLGQQKFTGTIDNTSVQSALKALSLTAPISYHVKEGVVLLYIDRGKAQYFK